MAVDAFHGHAHNRLCQLSNHPLFLKGFGLEDLATCERIFAGTNLATRLIQHASHFHWLQFLDLQMDQWDKDKYLELSMCSINSHLLFANTGNAGKFLFNNYKQAIAIISDYTPDINALKAISPGLANEDFIKWREEETQYLRSLRLEPEYDAQVVAYVEALEAVKKAQQVFFFIFFLPSRLMIIFQSLVRCAV